MRSKGSLSVHRVLPVLAPAVAGLALLGGCEDPTAADRADVHQQIDSARTDLAHALAGVIRPGAEGYDEARQELETVVTTLKGINGGSKGQQGAAELLAATALHELAAMDQDAMDLVNDEINRLRATAAANTRAALMLTDVAAARTNIDISDERAKLDDVGASAQRELTEVSQVLSELSDPIAEREQQNTQDQARIVELRDRAEALYRQADDAGPADGMEDFLAAQRLMREADQLERAISERLIELDYDYAAEHTRLTNRVESLRAQLEAVGTTRSDLDSLVQAFEADAADTRAKAAELAGNARSAMAEIETRMADELLPRYQAASQNLQDAASRAQSAAGKLDRDASSTARIARARALAALGQLHLLHANGLKRQLDVARQLASMPGAGDMSARADALESAHQEAMRSAVQAYTDARDAASSISGGQEAAALQQRLGEMVAKLTGEAMPTADTTAAAPSRDGQPTIGAITPPPMNTGDGAGLSSPAEFVSLMSSSDISDLDQSDRFFGACTASTPAGQAMMQLLRANTDFTEAMVNQFGADATTQAFQDVTGQSGSAFMDVRVESEDDSTAVVSLAMQGLPSRVNVDLANNNGGWFLDVDSLAAGLQGMPGGQMIGQMLGMQAAAFAAVTPRVEAGEFTDANAALQAFMADVQGRMGGLQPG